MSKKYISFSLWGSSRLYCEGAIENIACAKKYLPDFICRFYVAEDCPALAVLQQLDCEVVVMPNQKGIDRTNDKWVWQADHVAMFWRYFVIDEMHDGDVVIFRDCDSRISERDKFVIEDWLKRPECVHRIAENDSHHNSFCMGGMWGIKGGELLGVCNAICEWVEYYKNVNHPWIFVDLEFNTNVLAPAIGHKTIGYGHKLEIPLLPLNEDETHIGWVIKEEWRDQKFNPHTYLFNNGPYDKHGWYSLNDVSHPGKPTCEGVKERLKELKENDKTE